MTNHHAAQSAPIAGLKASCAPPIKAPYKPRPVGSLAEATTLLVQSVGGPAAAAEIVGVSPQAVRYWTDPDEPENRTIPAHAVLKLERVAPYPYVSAFLARQAGYDAQPVQGAPGDTGMVIERVQTFNAAFGNVQSGLIAGLDDGHLDDLERVMIGGRLAVVLQEGAVLGRTLGSIGTSIRGSSLEFNR